LPNSTFLNHPYLLISQKAISDGETLEYGDMSKHTAESLEEIEEIINNVIKTKS